MKKKNKNKNRDKEKKTEVSLVLQEDKNAACGLLSLLEAIEKGEVFCW